MLSCVRLFANPRTVACQSPLFVEFPRQEYWRWLPFPSPGHLPNPGIEPRSPALQVDALLSEPPEKPNIHWIIEKVREFQKNIYFCFIDYAKAFYCVDHNKLENSSRDGNTRPAVLPLGMQVRKQQLELDMEQQTGSKLGKEYIKAVYCHPAYLTCMQSTS